MKIGKRQASKPLIVTFCLPPKELSPNVRCHWAKKMRIVKQYRYDCGIAAKCAIMDLPGTSGPRWESAQIQVTYFRTTRHPQHAIDHDNAISWLKPGLDALQDASVIANDRGLTFLPVKFDYDKAHPRVELEITV